MEAGDGWPRFLDAGDRGLVVEFGDRIDEAISERVIALDDALAAAHIDGVCEAVPTYRSLLVVFDPVRLRRHVLRANLERLMSDLGDASAAIHRRWTIPVIYGGPFGEDLDEVAKAHDLTAGEVVRLHSGADYRVYMIGFMPGFTYLGGLPEAIHTSRRPTPRQKTPPRSVSIGGRQTAISPPIAIPSAWQMLGQTPVRVYDPRRVDAPFLFKSGDRIRFVAITEAQYDVAMRAADGGQVVAEVEEYVATDGTSSRVGATGMEARKP